MDDLIAGLTILRKYGNKFNPTHCEHDQLTVDVSPSKVSDQDISALFKLGFIADDCSDSFISYRFGSC